MRVCSNLHSRIILVINFLPSEGALNLRFMTILNEFLNHDHKGMNQLRIRMKALEGLNLCIGPGVVDTGGDST